MFNFDFNWDWSNFNLDALNEPMPVLDNNWLAQVEREIAALSTVVTEAVVNSPAVFDAPVNTAPNIDAVEQSVQQVVQAIAPVVAPSLPDYILELTTPLFVDEIAYSPEVLAAPVGQTVPPKAVETIVENIVNTAVKDETFVNSVAASIPDYLIQRLPEELQGEIANTVSQAIETVAQAPDMPDTFATYASFRQKEIADEYNIQTQLPPEITRGELERQQEVTTPATSDLVYRGGASVTPDLVYRGGAEEQKLSGTQPGLRAGQATETSAEQVVQPMDIMSQRYEAAARAAGLTPTYTSAETVLTPTEIASQESGTIGAKSIESQNAPFTPVTIDVSKVRQGDETSMVPPAPTTITSPSALAAQESGTIGAASIAAQQAAANAAASAGITSGAESGTIGAIRIAAGLDPVTGEPVTTTTTSTTTTTPTTTTATTTTATTTTATTTGPTTTATTTVFTPGPVTTVPINPATGLPYPTQTLPGGLPTQTITPVTSTPTVDINRESALKALEIRFANYGLSTLIPKIRELAISGANESTITLQLQETEEYRQRFKANQDRIKKGLAVLSPGDYINLEDNYRQILRAYGLNQFDRDDYVSQFIENDVSSAELSSRVQTAVQRVQNSDPAVLNTLTRFYGIGQNDLVAYVLDPDQQFQKIERQVAAAEIGAAAKLQGFDTGVAVAEQLAAQGISQAEARKGYSTIADILPSAEKLSAIYGTTLQGYGLAEAEQEVFNTLASAQRKRRKLVEREVAEFGGASGVSKASLRQQVGGQF